jgi:hypothetical protein
VRAVAILGDDTSAFRSEQALLEITWVRFFTDIVPAVVWLGRASGDPGQARCSVL